MKNKIKKKHIPYFILIIFGLLIFMMGILNHYYFKTATYDYGNYNFAFWDYSHFRISVLPMFKGNFLQDHFSFTLMYFVPLYWLFNFLFETYTLIIIQCSLIIVAAWYSYRLIKIKTDNFWLSVGVLVYYFLLLGRYTAFGADVNLAIISACFVPIFLYYFEIKKYFIAMVIMVFSLFSRENISLWFIFIFIVLIVEHRNEKKAILYGLIGVVVSILYFILLFKVFIPSVENPENQYSLFNYSALGANPGEAFEFMISNPIETIRLFFVNHLKDASYDGLKVEFYLVYLISGGFVLFYRPQYLIWFFPIVAQKVLNDVPVRWGISSYYSVEVVTLLPLSVFLVLSAIKHRLLQNTLAVVVCIGAIGMTVNKFDLQNCRVPWMMNPPKEKFYDKDFYKQPFNVKSVNSLLSNIPKDARVSASNMLLPHLAQRKFIYFFPTVKDAEYIVFSLFDNYYLFSQEENEKSRLKYLSDPRWEIISVEYPVILLKFNEASESSKNALDMLWAKSDTLFCNYEKVDSANSQILFSNGEFADKLENLTTEVARSFESSIVLPTKNSFSSSVKIDDSDKICYLELSVWCSPDSANKGFIVISGKNGFYKVSFESDSIDSFGWRKLILNTWIPKESAGSYLSVYFGNDGSEPTYFDDFQIVKKSRNSWPDMN